jgi:hypothetical protein
MRLGGNRRAAEFFRANGVNDLYGRQDTKYNCSTARLYRAKLAKFMEDDAKGGSKVVEAPPPPPPPAEVVDGLDAMLMDHPMGRTASAPQLVSVIRQQYYSNPM